MCGACFLGLIQVHAFVKLQHRMLLEKLKQVEMQERALRASNRQLGPGARGQRRKPTNWRARGTALSRPPP
jgi:hypothetical protein